MKALLQSYLDGTAYACSELVDTLIKQVCNWQLWLQFIEPCDHQQPGIRSSGTDLQSSVGTVVKSADGSDPIGLLSVLNTQRYKDLGALAQIRNYLIQNCTNNETKTALQQVKRCNPPGASTKIAAHERDYCAMLGCCCSAGSAVQAWGSSGTGLLVSERLINCPPQVAAPLQQALFDEIQWATEDEPTQVITTLTGLESACLMLSPEVPDPGWQELRDSFKFERYVAASRVFADLSTSAPSGNQGKKRKVQLVSADGFWSWQVPADAQLLVRDLERWKLPCRVHSR